MLTFALVAAGTLTAFGQQQPADPMRTPGVQAGGDPNRAAFLMANCKNPAPAPAARAGGPGGRGAPGAPAAGGGRGGAAPPAQPTEYTVTAIPGVIAAGQRWRVLWTDTGNNADSPIGVEDGVLVAQNDKSQILKIGLDGKVELVATDTYTGGALAMTRDGRLFVGERALNRGIWQVSPRRLFTNTKDGEPLECLGQGVLNDMVADANGGMYFTMGGVYYANPQGVVSGRFGAVGGNGLILSRDGRTLYVTGRLMGANPPANLTVPAGAPMPTGGLVAFDVQPNGTLTNERQFTWAGGDGTAIDNDGRIHTTGNGGVWVIGTAGDILGFIPGPNRGLISVAFGGPNKRTLFGVAIRDVQIFAIDMIAQGFTGRPK
ncbi:MAG: SMP-30/gluconolactonase/LRE family protein [Acidobacteria bacterium]|nr:SMP-30/gluconolactonase/LRE family protein [Acidobacteriota bacterium]